MLKWVGNAVLNYWLKGGQVYVGREIKADTEAVKAGRTLAGLDAKLADAAPGKKAELHYKRGTLYENLSKAPAEPEAEIGYSDDRFSDFDPSVWLSYRSHRKAAYNYFFFFLGTAGFLILGYVGNPFSKWVWLGVSMAGFAQGVINMTSNALAANVAPKPLLGSIMGGKNSMAPIGSLIFLQLGDSFLTSTARQVPFI